MDFGEGEIPEKWPMSPRLLKARAFIHEFADVIWILGAVARLTKEEVGGNELGRVGVEATKQRNSRSRH